MGKDSHTGWEKISTGIIARTTRKWHKDVNNCNSGYKKKKEEEGEEEKERLSLPLCQRHDSNGARTR